MLDAALTDTITGRTGRRLLVTTPPRHGKSFLCSQYFPAWYLGTYPHRRIILTSYEASFAASWGRKARNLLEEHGALFGVRVAEDSHAANAWAIQGHEGGMITAGAGGPITGRGGDVLIIDDPHKNAEESQSEVIRDKIWDWWQSTAYTRLEPNGSVILIQTRWHEDDLAGRLLAEAAQGGEQWRVINFPAIAEADDMMGRQPGEALWPARYDVAALKRIEKTVGPQVWAALYQQRPAPLEGGLLKRAWFQVVKGPAPRSGWESIVRAWDLAATEGDGDYTSGTLFGIRGDQAWIIDVTRGQWGPGRRDDYIELTAQSDDEIYGKAVRIHFPQDPGQAGKMQTQDIAKRLRGYPVEFDVVSGDKAVRLRPFASHAWTEARRGNEHRIRLVEGPWVKPWLDELCTFPNGTFDDQCDSTADAFNLAAKPKKKFMMGLGK